MEDETKKAELHSEFVETIVSILRNLPRDRVMVMAEFIAQATAIDDPDALQTFVALRRDPRLDTLLQLASQLDGDDLDQVIFFTEDAVVERSRKRT